MNAQDPHRNSDWAMSFACRMALTSIWKTSRRLAMIMDFQQDRIDDEGCGSVFAAARWPLVRKRKDRHKI